MDNSSYFRFDDDNKTKYIYSLNHHKVNGQTENTQPPHHHKGNGQTENTQLPHIVQWITTGVLRTKVECLWIYILNWVLTNFPYKLLWTTMDTLWTVVNTQSRSIVVGKHFTVTMIKLLNVLSRIPIIHLLPIYFLQTHHGMLGRQYISKGVCRCEHCRAWPWTQLSVSLQQVEESEPKPVRWTMCFLLTSSSLAWTLMIVCTSV